MAASTFTIFNKAKGKLGSAALDLSTGIFRLVLVKSNAVGLSAGASASTWTSLQVDGVSGLATAGNYSIIGTSLTNPSWRASGAAWVFDTADWSLSANAVAHASIKAYIIRASAGDKLIGYASLSATTSIAASNKLIIAMPAAGIFDLT